MRWQTPDTTQQQGLDGATRTRHMGLRNGLHGGVEPGGNAAWRTDPGLKVEANLTSLIGYKSLLLAFPVGKPLLEPLNVLNLDGVASG